MRGCKRIARHVGFCKSHATDRADEWFSLEVRSADRCKALDAWAGKPVECKGVYQCCHLIPRGYRNVRWLRNNAVCMCKAHHLSFDNNPLERQMTIELWIGEDGWWAMHEHALVVGYDWRADLEEILERRQDELEIDKRVRQGPG